MLRVPVAGDDDAQTCTHPVWAVQGIHLSLIRGAEFAEECEVCGAVRYRTGDGYEQRSAGDA